MHDEPELKIARDAWLWKNKIRFKTSKEAPPFPEPNFQKYRDFSSKEMFELFISENILEEIANQYALTKMVSFQESKAVRSKCSLEY